MSEMIFEIEGNRAYPRLPRGLKPDGVKYFTPAQVAERLGGTEQRWRDEWISSFGVYLQPAATSDPVEAVAVGDPVVRVDSVVGWDIVHVVRFPHLNEEQWAFVVRECRRRNIDPMEIWVKLRTNQETKKIEPVIITTLGVFRRIAQATGFRGAESPVEFCGEDCNWIKGPWPNGSGHPHAARVMHWRKDIPEPFEGVAYFDRCAQYIAGPDGGKPVLTECWAQANGAPQLAKCATVAAYRAAYTELTNLYTLDEMRTGKSSPDEDKPVAPAASRTESGEIFETTGTAPIAGDIPDDPRIAIRYVDETTPSSLDRLPLELVYAGVGNMAAAKTLIATAAQRWPRLFARNVQAFCGVVLEMCRRQQGGGEPA